MTQVGLKFKIFYSIASYTLLIITEGWIRGFIIFLLTNLQPTLYNLKKLNLYLHLRNGDCAIRKKKTRK